MTEPRRPAESPDEQLPATVRRDLEQVPDRLRHLQVGGLWISGLHLGMVVPGLGIGCIGLSYMIGMVHWLVLFYTLAVPMVLILLWRGFRQLDLRPFHQGVICTVLLTILTGLYLVPLLSSLLSGQGDSPPEFAPSTMEQILTYGLTLLGSVILIFQTWLNILLLRSLPMLMRYGHARMEYPDSVDSLATFAHRRRTRHLIDGAVWKPVVLGISFTCLTFAVGALSMS